MNKSIEVLKSIYKPLRYVILGRSTLLNTMNGDFIVKEKGANDLKELFSYLESRSFNGYPKIIDSSRKDVYMYEYIEGVKMPLEQKAMDLIDLISDLHNKTTFYKTVTEDDFKSIYDKIKENIIYLEQEFNNLYETIKKENYMSPSHYSLIRNIYKIFAALKFASSELDEWFNLVKNETKKRVCYIHNKLSLDHFVKNDKNYLISWEDARIDSPVVDLVKFYQNEYFNVHFATIFKRYLERVTLSSDEKKLFFILISLPKNITFTNDEFTNCKLIRNVLDYVFITEELIRPYYAIEQE